MRGSVRLKLMHRNVKLGVDYDLLLLMQECCCVLLESVRFERDEERPRGIRFHSHRSLSGPLIFLHELQHFYKRFIAVFWSQIQCFCSTFTHLNASMPFDKVPF